MVWRVCPCGTPFNTDTLNDGAHCSKGCSRRAGRGSRITQTGEPSTGPLADAEIQYWLTELSHRPDMIAGGVRRTMARTLVELTTLRAAIALHQPVMTETQDDRWECCAIDGADWPCPTAEAMGQR